MTEIEPFARKRARSRGSLHSLLPLAGVVVVATVFFLSRDPEPPSLALEPVEIEFIRAGVWPSPEGPYLIFLREGTSASVPSVVFDRNRNGESDPSERLEVGSTLVVDGERIRLSGIDAAASKVTFERHSLGEH